MLSLYNKCHELFECCDGKLIRKINASPNARKGDVAGTLDISGGGIGYYRVKIDKKSYLLHRLIYLMTHRELPEVVDHIDGDTHNNRIENLRASDKKKNRWNCNSNEFSQSGVKGVYRDNKKWKALINVNGKRYYLGMYDTIESAKIVVDMKYVELQGEYSKQNSTLPNNVYVKRN